eukprot:365066-Chlamydomonas_euryale.AAC.7
MVQSNAADNPFTGAWDEEHGSKQGKRDSLQNNASDNPFTAAWDEEHGSKQGKRDLLQNNAADNPFTAARDWIFRRGSNERMRREGLQAQLCLQRACNESSKILGAPITAHLSTGANGGIGRKFHCSKHLSTSTRSDLTHSPL